jgi:hypothetical protein
MVPALAQTRDDKVREAYGSRIGDRGQDPNNAGVNGDLRTSKRLDTRIKSRIGNRIERFVAPPTDNRSAYTPNADDTVR